MHEQFRGTFSFRLASGAEPHLRLPSNMITTLHRCAGRWRLQLPPPYADLTIDQDETVSYSKWARICAAVEAFERLEAK